MGHVTAVEDDRSAGRLDETGDRAEQRRLSGAVRPEERDDLALVDLEVDAEQHLNAVVVHVDTTYEEELGPPSLPFVHGLRLCGRCRPHSSDVARDLRPGRGEDESAKHEHRRCRQQRAPDAVGIGDPADHGEQEQAGDDPRGGDSEAEGAHLRGHRQREHAVDAWHEQAERGRDQDVAGDGEGQVGRLRERDPHDCDDARDAGKKLEHETRIACHQAGRDRDADEEAHDLGRLGDRGDDAPLHLVQAEDVLVEQRADRQQADDRKRDERQRSEDASKCADLPDDPPRLRP